MNSSLEMEGLLSNVARNRRRSNPELRCQPLCARSLPRAYFSVGYCAIRVGQDSPPRATWLLPASRDLANRRFAIVAEAGEGRLDTN